MTTEHVYVDLADLRNAADESDDVVVVPAWLMLELLNERQRLRDGLETIVRGMGHEPGTWDNMTRLVDGFYRGVAARALAVPE